MGFNSVCCGGDWFPWIQMAICVPIVTVLSVLVLMLRLCPLTHFFYKLLVSPSTALTPQGALFSSACFPSLRAFVPTRLGCRAIHAKSPTTMEMRLLVQTESVGCQGVARTYRDVTPELSRRGFEVIRRKRGNDRRIIPKSGSHRTRFRSVI